MHVNHLMPYHLQVQSTRNHVELDALYSDSRYLVSGMYHG